MSDRPLLLDLYCCAGGAAMGYHKAGFDVVGVDRKSQPHYPFEFIQADALEYMRGLMEDGPVWQFQAIHASPPCQRFSKSVSKANREKHPDLVALTRDLLVDSGLPYVIENVPRAPLVNPVQLCGTTLGLRGLQRHRIFETNFPLWSPGCAHGVNEPRFAPAWNRKNPLRVRPISGGWTDDNEHEANKQAMGVDWDVTPTELSEAIPPAYTEFIGSQLLERMELLA